jgi:hypothetical protein
MTPSGSSLNALPGTVKKPAWVLQARLAVSKICQLTGNRHGAVTALGAVLTGTAAGLPHATRLRTDKDAHTGAFTPVRT